MPWGLRRAVSGLLPWVQANLQLQPPPRPPSPSLRTLWAPCPRPALSFWPAFLPREPAWFSPPQAQRLSSL